MARVQEHKDVIATKGTKDTKVKSTKPASTRPLDAPPKAAACGTGSQGMNRRSIIRVHAVAIPFHTRPASAQADPSSGHGFVNFVLLNFVLLNFVLFVPFVAPDLRALDRERRE